MLEIELSHWKMFNIYVNFYQLVVQFVSANGEDDWQVDWTDAIYKPVIICR